MYKTTADFVRMLSGLSGLEQLNLSDAIASLGYGSRDSKRVAELREQVGELKDEVWDLGKEITGLKSEIHDRDAKLDEINQIVNR